MHLGLLALLPLSGVFDCSSSSLCVFEDSPTQDTSSTIRVIVNCINSTIDSICSSVTNSYNTKYSTFNNYTLYIIQLTIWTHSMWSSTVQYMLSLHTLYSYLHPNSYMYTNLSPTKSSL